MAKYTLTFDPKSYPNLPEEKAYVESVYAKFLRGNIAKETAQWNDKKNTLTAEVDDTKAECMNVLKAINEQKGRYPCFQKLEKRNDC